MNAFTTRCLCTLFLVTASHLSAPAANAETVSFGGRSSNLVVPSGYDPGTPAPLVVLLHGYTATGAGQDAYMGFSAISDEFGFLMLNPDGLIDGGGNFSTTCTRHSIE
jgi:polyhydroxybutyrate depolymerase